MLVFARLGIIFVTWSGLEGAYGVKPTAESVTAVGEIADTTFMTPPASRLVRTEARSDASAEIRYSSALEGGAGRPSAENPGGVVPMTHFYNRGALECIRSAETAKSNGFLEVVPKPCQLHDGQDAQFWFKYIRSPEKAWLWNGGAIDGSNYDGVCLQPVGAVVEKADVELGECLTGNKSVAWTEVEAGTVLGFQQYKLQANPELCLSVKEKANKMSNESSFNMLELRSCATWEHLRNESIVAVSLRQYWKVCVQTDMTCTINPDLAGGDASELS